MLYTDPVISETISIESPARLGEVLREATERDRPVVPFGAGTCLSTGNNTNFESLGLDLSAISGIETYVPTDMTASFLAGTSLREVRETLAANGQELPIDIGPDDAGTIGGLVATGFSGPRRLGQGTLKDLIIGGEYVRGDGLLAKAGGMTVKNVSGFEISRTLHGSWGSLAVLTRINMKVLPLPRAERTLVWQDRSVQDSLSRQRSLLEALPMAVSAQTVQTLDGVATHIRFMGREVAVDAYVERASSLVGTPDTIADDRDVWILPAGNHQSPQLVCTVPVDELEALATQMAATPGISSIRVSLGTATVWAVIDPGAITASEVAALALSLWTIEGGSVDWKRDVDVWGVARGDRDLALSVKREFDPADVLNRGRLFV